jgi:hypothetical protein
MVGILCLLLAFANSGLRAQGEVVFTGFAIDWAVRSAQVVRRYAPSAQAADSLARQRHLLAQDRLLVKDYIRIAHITRRLSPNATGAEVHAAQQLMDSLYQRLQAGADFAALARDYSQDPTAPQGGQMPWVRLTEQLQEWIDVLQALPRDSVSRPFLSPLGIHLVKWTDRLEAVPEEAALPGLRHWAERRVGDDPAGSVPVEIPFRTDLEELCTLYPEAAGELRALYARMRTEYRGEDLTDSDADASKPLTKAEKKALKKADKAAAKEEARRRKADEKARKEEAKAAKRKNIVKKQ